MDIQGFEYQALLGIKELLSANQHIKLVMEYWPFGLSMAESDPKAVIDFLQQMNFKIFIFISNKLLPFSHHLINISEKDYYNLFLLR